MSARSLVVAVAGLLVGAWAPAGGPPDSPLQVMEGAVVRDGAGVAGARVEWRGSGESCPDMTSGSAAGGRFVFRARPGCVYDVVVGPLGTATYGARVALPDESVPVDLVVPPGSTSGRVFEGARPAAKIAISSERTTPAAGSRQRGEWVDGRLRVLLATEQASCESDEQGVFELPPLAATEYRIRAVAADGRSAEIVFVPGGASGEPRVTLPRKSFLKRAWEWLDKGFTALFALLILAGLLLSGLEQLEASFPGARIAVAFLAGLVLLIAAPLWAIWRYDLRLLPVAAAVAVGAAASLLASLLRRAVLGGGYKASGTHEWRYVDRRGKPAARFGDASRKEVYEHLHGRGSWEERGRYSDWLILAVAVAAAVVFLHLQFAPSSWIPYAAAAALTLPAAAVVGLVTAR